MAVIQAGGVADLGVDDVNISPIQLGTQIAGDGGVGEAVVVDLSALGDQTGLTGTVPAHQHLGTLVVVGDQHQDLGVLGDLQGQDALIVTDDGDSGSGDVTLHGTVLGGTDGGQSLLQGVVSGVVIQDATVLLDGQDTGDGVVDTGHGDGAVLDSGDDTVDDGVQVSQVSLRVQGAGHADHVQTSLDGDDDGLDLIPGAGDTGHVHGVGDHDALEAHLALQQAGQDVIGHGGGQGLFLAGLVGQDLVALQLGVQDVSGHDHFDALLDGDGVGLQLVLQQNIQGLIDHGQAVVGVSSGIAMAGEVLGGADNIILSQTGDDSGSQLADHGGVITEGTQADNGVVGVVVHIDDGSQVGVDAQNGQLGADDQTGVVSVLGAALSVGCAQSHIAGQGSAGAQTVDGATLLVSGNQQGDAAVLDGSCLHGLSQIEGLLSLLNVVSKEDDGTEVVIFDDLADLIVHNGEVLGSPVTEVNHQHLGDLVAKGHAVDQISDPVCGLCRDKDSGHHADDHNQCQHKG